MSGKVQGKTLQADVKGQRDQRRRREGQLSMAHGRRSMESTRQRDVHKGVMPGIRSMVQAAIAQTCVL